jgi:hypothetical protein
MNKLLLSLTFATFAAFSTASNALEKSFEMYAGSSAGGLNTIFQTVLVEELTKRGWNIDFKVIGNCGQVMTLLDSTDAPVASGWGNSWNIEGNLCNRPPNAETFIETLLDSPRLVCGPLDTPDFAFVPGKKYVIGTNTDQGHEIILGALAEKLGVEFKVVPYKNSGAIVKAIASKEIQAWYTTRGLTEHNAGTQKCLYGTLAAPAFGITPLNELFDTNTVYSSFTGYLIVNDKFSPELKAALQKDATEIVTSDLYKEQLSVKSSYLAGGDKDSQIKAVIASARAYEFK